MNSLDMTNVKCNKLYSRYKFDFITSNELLDDIFDICGNLISSLTIKCTNLIR